MRAPTTAAFFDYEDTAQLNRAVQRGEAPRPTSIRGSTKEPIWSRAVCDEWIARRHSVADNGPGRATAENDLKELLLL
jgi:hypothetical protein